MQLWKRILGVLMVLAATLVVSGWNAEAKYLASHVTIEGPILHEPIVIDDEDGISRFVGGFIALSGDDVMEPVRPGHLFLVTVFRQDESGQQIPVDRVVVSLDTAARSAQLYRLGMVNGWMTGDGRWYKAAPDAVTALLGALEGAGVSFDRDGAILGLPQLQTVPAPSEPRPSRWYLASLPLAALAFAAGWRIGSRRRRRPTRAQSASAETS